ncbi:MAG: cell division protein FtsK/SpoIIIE, partial [Planctomycetaceae bacterium]|nr:cell division protein FtsK/SpoIIIE [Planctomycetaceae bacterium]
GMGAYALLGALLVLDIRLFARTPLKDPLLRLFGAFLSVAALCSLLQGLVPGFGRGPIIGSGGYIGAWGWALLGEYFTATGICFFLTASFLAGMLISTDLWMFRILAWLTIFPAIWLKLRQPRKEPSWPNDAGDDSGEANLVARHGFSRFDAPGFHDPIEDEEPWELVKSAVAPAVAQTAAVTQSAIQPRNPVRINAPVTMSASRRPAPRPETEPRPERHDHPLPPSDLLSEAEEFPFELLAKRAQIAAETLEKTFKQFGLNVRVVEIDTGPVITQFELELEAGLRLNKITALSDDLAIALRVPSVRVVAPIPGKNTVGVEVPNDKQVMVRLRELIDTCAADAASKRIPIFLGKDVTGRPLTVDLAKMPHLLIAGRTGTGKSVCLNTLILSMLMTRTPEQVRMLMIDPKMVELSPYTRIPHLMHPVITDMKKAEAVLGWAVEKMEERYDLLSRCGVRHLDSYNKLGREEVIRRLDIDPDSPEADQIAESMPYIVIIADEMADMMMTSGKEVEAHIIRLAQKSRAVGIHLVLATQKPTVDVITGLIKSNLPARIAFQVSSRTDSRVVLDEMGADKLLGNGDMLYLAPGTSNLTRAQGTYVSDEEMNAIIEFYSDQPPQYSRELQTLKPAGGKGDGKSLEGNLKERDAIYEQAVEVIIREGRGSCSLLQRALGIGYGKAARLIDYMAEDGIVGAYNGAQAREVLYTWDQWQSMVNGEELESADA